MTTQVAPETGPWSAATTPLRFLITGGAGFLGINLVRHLRKRGHDVTSLDLEPFDYEDVKDEIRIVTGDIRNRADVDLAMTGAKIVVHTAAALPLYKKEDIYSTDIDGTRNVLASAIDHGVLRAIHVSSTAVYGIPDHHPLVESDPMQGVGPYGEAKVKAEEMCHEFREKGLTVPIIRRLDSWVRWAAASKLSSLTSLLNITPCTMPLPSRTSRKCSLPLLRML